MAIYHFSAKIISRGGGRSAIAAAAYRAAEMLDDHLTSQVYDYTAKQGVVHSEILLPTGAPARFLDRSTLWNEVEANERRKDAQLARDIEIALPRELSRTEAISLVRDFVSEQFVARGMIADLNVHWGKTADGEEQPHAHVMLTMRSVSEEGFGPKVREWNSTAMLMDWRERWSELANERLCTLGYDVRIDHRSYAEQEIPLQPQHKIGPAGARREARGEDAERAAEHRTIASENGARLLQEPEIALRALTHQHSTFSKRDLARFVSRHSDGADQFTAVMAVVQASPELVRVGEDGRGQERFSTREMLETEARLERDALALAAASGHAVSERDKATALRRTSAGSGAGSGGLGIEQQAAFVHVTGDADLAVVVRFAGTGKSTMLGTARIAWEAAGYRVQGAALSGIAAEGLEGGSGIESRTIHSRLHAWAQGREELTSRDVLVVDEAGMIGSRMMDQLVSRVREAGGKLVLVGDPEQLQAIEAGAAFRAIADRVGTVEITEVRRQRAAWQRTATRELATSGTAEALERYTEAGMVHASNTLAEAKAALVVGWDLERQRQPNESRVMLASTRADVTDLNQLARGRLQAAGELGSDHVVQTERGERSFANGDRLMFLRNERGLGGNAGGRNSVAVKNGTLGTLMAVESGGERLTVRLDGSGPEGSENGRYVTFYLRDYAHLDHGYAATVHKAQGVTVDRAHVLATEMMDRHAAYVGLTRHRDGVALHYARDTFGDAAQLARALGRERAKDTTLDYGVEAQVLRYATRRGLVPESEIVLKPASVQQPEAERPGPRRSRFGGLRLNASRAAEPSIPAAPEPTLQASPVRTPTEPERQWRTLEGLMADYARAWSDAKRMRRAELPVLSHQETALETAGRALEAFASGASRDMRAALEAGPELARGMDTIQGRQALATAAAELRCDRLALEERGLSTVRAWGTLERAYEAAGKRYAWDEQRKAGTSLEAFAKALKRDPQLDNLLRDQGRELGIEAGSRLDQVVRAPEVDWRLLRSIAIEHGPRRRSGPSMGM